MHAENIVFTAILRNRELARASIYIPDLIRNLIPWLMKNGDETDERT
jgi:hypothetical protein